MKLPKWLVTVTPFTRFLALMMLIIFPIVGFLIGRYYQANTQIVMQTPDPTVDWKSYSNNMFSFDYLTSWTVSTSLGNLNPKMFKDCNLYVYNTSIIIGFDLKGNESYCWSYGEFTGIQTGLNNSSISKWTDFGKTWQGDLFEMSNKGKLNVGMVFSADSETEAETTLSQILSTFKFTN